MRKSMLLLASAAVLTVSSVAAPALARDRDRQDRGEVTATQLVNRADAATAQMKADLHITAAQEKDWNAFEAARHDMSRRHAERAVAMRADERAARAADKAARSDARAADGRMGDRTADEKPTVGKTSDTTTSDKTTRDTTTDNNRKATSTGPTLIDRINANADAQIARANDWKKLAEAAGPLYASFDDQQKRYFADLLFGAERDNDRDRPRSRDRDDR